MKTQFLLEPLTKRFLYVSYLCLQKYPRREFGKISATRVLDLLKDVVSRGRTWCFESFSGFSMFGDDRVITNKNSVRPQLWPPQRCTWICVGAHVARSQHKNFWKTFDLLKDVKTQKLPNFKITPDPTRSLSKKARRKKFDPKRIVFEKGDCTFIFCTFCKAKMPKIGQKIHKIKIWPKSGPKVVTSWN